MHTAVPPWAANAPGPQSEQVEWPLKGASSPSRHGTHSDPSADDVPGSQGLQASPSTLPTPSSAMLEWPGVHARPGEVDATTAGTFKSPAPRSHSSAAAACAYVTPDTEKWTVTPASPWERRRRPVGGPEEEEGEEVPGRDTPLTFTSPARTATPVKFPTLQATASRKACSRAGTSCKGPGPVEAIAGPPGSGSRARVRAGGVAIRVGGDGGGGGAGGGGGGAGGGGAGGGGAHSSGERAPEFDVRPGGHSRGSVTPSP